jgi:hypothetical protein
MTVLAVIAFFGLINGGYVYKTTCPLAGGAKQTSWTYAISDVLPYIRHTSAPCHAHTGTRLLLDTVGLVKIHDANAAVKMDPRNLAVAESLGSAVVAIKAEFARERKATAAFGHMNARTMSKRDKVRLGALLHTGIAKFETIRSRLDAHTTAPDSQLEATRALLSTWLGYQIAADRIYFVARSKQDFLTRARRFARSVSETGAKLNPMVLEVQTKYPEVKGLQALWQTTSG